jgi:hypothetical protein
LKWQFGIDILLMLYGFCYMFLFIADPEVEML